MECFYLSDWFIITNSPIYKGENTQYAILKGIFPKRACFLLRIF